MKIRNKVAIFFIFLILPTIVFLRIVSFSAMGCWDVGTYAYIGDMILKGQIPYRDIWDNKPPLIYYLNALLFKIFGSHYNTIAIFEIGWIFITSIFIYKLARSIFQRTISLCISLIFAVYISTLQIAQCFGEIETYAILPSIISVLSVIQYKKTAKSFFLFISGLMVSAAFLFKPNFAIIVLPLILYLMINSFYKKQSILYLLSEYLILVLGILVPIIIFSIYFFINGALHDVISQIFIYNLFYHRIGTAKPLLSYLIKIIKELIASPLGRSPFLIIFATVGILYNFSDLFKEIRNKVFIKNISRFNIFILLLFWFLFSLYGISFSGRYFRYYYLGAIPSLALLTGYTLDYFFRHIKSSFKLICFLGISFLFASPLPRDIYTYNTFGLNKSKKNFNKDKIIYMDTDRLRYREDLPVLIKWIMANTAKDDFIYFWGHAVELNFVTKRKSPTKYIHLFPLQTSGYVKNSDIERAISDLKENKPKFIIDTGPFNRCFFPPLDLRNTSNKDYIYDIKHLLPIINFINNNYAYETSVEGWDIYKLK
jgi:4-amino-4-deoxy-L-arabinose transferase-like glycosyltransferase